MYVSHLSLLDFRSYAQVDLELEPGVNALVGPNGQGKTNLVEAIGYVATLGSHRVASDAALVRSGQERALIRSRVVRGDRASTIEIEINHGRANRARVNRAAAAKVRDVVGILRTVLFAPEDLVLVKGDPDARRRFLDELTVLVTPRMSSVLSDYDRVLRQRSALLKSAGFARRTRSGTPDLSTLDVWDARLAQLGAQVVAVRQRLVRALAPHVQLAYEEVSAGQGDAVISYRSSLAAAVGAEQVEDAVPGPAVQSVADLEAQMIGALTLLRPKELERGVCLVGPHRDDLGLVLGGLPAKGYASHGESWSFALALRLASYRFLAAGTPGGGAVSEDELWVADPREDGEPVLILDDVFAELDVRRRDRLAGLVSGARQVIITAAVPDDVPGLLRGTRHDVLDGQVTHVH